MVLPLLCEMSNSGIVTMLGLGQTDSAKDTVKAGRYTTLYFFILPKKNYFRSCFEMQLTETFLSKYLRQSYLAFL